MGNRTLDSFAGLQRLQRRGRKERRQVNGTPVRSSSIDACFRKVFRPRPADLTRAHIDGALGLPDRT
jgi:hypothetical protein